MEVLDMKMRIRMEITIKKIVKCLIDFVWTR